MSNADNSKLRVFLSYGRQDTAEFAAKLSDWLKSQGYEPWLDVENGIPLGTPFDHRIEVGIGTSDILLAILSPWSVRPNGFCRNEILFAQSLSVPIVPIRIADVLPPIQIISLNYLDVSQNTDDVFQKLPGLLAEVATNRHVGFREWGKTESAPAWWTQLCQLDFTQELARHGGAFVGREWLFDALGDWTRQPTSRTLLLTGDAGIGKSAIVAQLTTRLNVKGVHFCTRSNIDSCRSESWVSGLIYQLAEQLPEYAAQIKQLPKPDWKEVESVLRTHIVDPLRRCEDELSVTEPWVFAVDGLDEAVAVAGNALPELLADTEVALPEWIRLIVTSRPDTSMIAMFKIDGVHRDHLEAERSENESDLDSYVASRVSLLPFSVTGPIERDNLGAAITRMARGNFLFAKMTIDALCDPDPEVRLEPAEIGAIPNHLGGLYHTMFRKRFRNIDRYEQELLPLLDCLVAATQEVPEDVLLNASGLDRRTGKKSLRTISQFVRCKEGGVLLFHKSLADWLVDGSASAEFSAEIVLGHERLAAAYWQRCRQDHAEQSEMYNASYHLNELQQYQEIEQLWDECFANVFGEGEMVIQEVSSHALLFVLPNEPHGRSIDHDLRRSLVIIPNGALSYPTFRTYRKAFRIADDRDANVVAYETTDRSLITSEGEGGITGLSLLRATRLGTFPIPQVIDRSAEIEIDCGLDRNQLVRIRFRERGGLWHEAKANREARFEDDEAFD